MSPPGSDRSFFDVVLNQRACRSYLPEAVPDDDLAAMVEAATHAPSAENRQPWVFVVVTDTSVRSAIGDLTADIWRRAGRAHSQQQLARGFFAEVDEFLSSGYGAAPALIVIGAEGRDGDSDALLAASIFPAIQNLLLAAAALGYGSSVTTLAALAPEALRALVGWPHHVRPFAVVPVGRPARRLGPPRRKPVPAVAHRNRFGVPFESHG